MSCVSNDLSDEALWLQSRSSESAREQLIRRFTRTVRAISRPFFLSGSDSEDLLQEGMIGLLAAMDGFDPAGDLSFAAFAALCIRRRVISAVRSASSQKQMLLTSALPMTDVTEPSPEPGPEELLLAQERAAELAANLQGCLSRLERQILGYYLDGWSYGQIAAAVGKTPKAVDNAVQRIRAKAARLKMADTGDTRSQ